VAAGFSSIKVLSSSRGSGFADVIRYFEFSFAMRVRLMPFKRPSIKR
jgi:hypothetical protein